MKDSAPLRVKFGVKTKLFGLILGTAVVSLLAACLVFVVYDRKSYAASKTATLTVLAASVADGAFGPVAFEDQESAQYVLRTVGSESTALGASIYLSDGKRLAGWERPGATVHLADKKADANTSGKGLLFIERPIAKNDSVVGSLVVVFSTEDIEARTKQFIRLAFSVLVGSIFLATLVVLAAHRVFTVPVGRLAAAAHLVQVENRFDVRVEPSSSDELGILTRAFNSMLEAVQNRDRELANHREHLEHLVEERTKHLDERNRSMRLVLDTVDQGLVTLSIDGRLDTERSRVFDEWFPVDAEGARFADVIERAAPGFTDRFEISFEQLGEGLLPLEVCLGQLPRSFSSTDGRNFSLDYRPVQTGDVVERVLVIATDVTDHVARERAAREQRQVIAMFEQIARDRGGFVEFLSDADEMAKSLGGGTLADRAETMRVLHTLKGNCGIFEISSVAEVCHRVEERCFESEDLPNASERSEILASWNQVAERARSLLGEVSGSLVIDIADYEELVAAVHTASPGSRLEKMVQRLSHEPVEPRFRKLGTQAERLGKRLELPSLEVNVQAAGVRLPPVYGWLWSLLPHLIRNSLDHGLANADTKKPILHLAARHTESQLEIEVGDNGRGIDWERVRAAAKKKGLPSVTKEDLARALFADEVSTKESATEISGRGVGMSAVLAEVKARGGRIEVLSKKGQGTVVKLVVPTKESVVLTTRTSILARSMLPVGFGASNDTLPKTAS